MSDHDKSPALERALRDYMAPIQDDGFTARMMQLSSRTTVDYADLPLLQPAQPSSVQRWSLALSMGGAVGLIASRLGDVLPADVSNISWSDINLADMIANSSVLSHPYILMAVGLMSVFGFMVLLLDSQSA